MTKTKKQLRAEAVERLKNCVAARFDAESIIIALTSGRRGQSDWSLECDKLIYLLTDDSNDDSTPEKVVSGSKPCVTPESCRQYADQRKQGDYADCESCDSREKLEADVFKAADDMEMFYNGERFIDTRKIIGWLDRQAAITERETTKRHELFCETCEAESDKQIAELKAERDQLTNAINELQKKQPYCYNPEQPLDSLNTIGRYIDELTAERDNLKDDLIDERGKLNRKMNALREVTRDYRNERDHYRSKFGKCIDYADAIHALMDDEGLA